MNHEGSRGGRVLKAPDLDERLVIKVSGELVEKRVMLARFVQPGA